MGRLRTIEKWYNILTKVLSDISANRNPLECIATSVRDKLSEMIDLEGFRAACPVEYSLLVLRLYGYNLKKLAGLINVSVSTMSRIFKDIHSALAPYRLNPDGDNYCESFYDGYQIKAVKSSFDVPDSRTHLALGNGNYHRKRLPGGGSIPRYHSAYPHDPIVYIIYIIRLIRL